MVIPTGPPTVHANGAQTAPEAALLLSQLKMPKMESHRSPGVSALVMELSNSKQPQSVRPGLTGAELGMVPQIPMSTQISVTPVNPPGRCSAIDMHLPVQARKASPVDTNQSNLHRLLHLAETLTTQSGPTTQNQQPQQVASMAQPTHAVNQQQQLSPSQRAKKRPRKPTEPVSPYNPNKRNLQVQLQGQVFDSKNMLAGSPGFKQLPSAPTGSPVPLPEDCPAEFPKNVFEIPLSPGSHWPAWTADPNTDNQTQMNPVHPETFEFLV
eukprot:TRINITY_DN6999_c0_g1_i4.p1 TRINITY_DN6999_c0_g1~~TRINITY_DN6999_c0_g1_i4.p1  ORF type:complete len:268 (-),score=38.80 TRINITY_DN6999_c0_g1_i4:270-1073(-)